MPSSPPPAKRPPPPTATATIGQPLIPGLPDDLAQLCLSHLPPSLLFSVSLPWRRLLYTPSFPPFLSLFALLSDSENLLSFSSFDPLSSSWSPLPPPPLSRAILLHHPSFLSRSLTVQSVSTAGHLVLIAASSSRLTPALNRPLAFQPRSCRWLLGPPFRFTRRWCAAGSANGSVFLASGHGSLFSSVVARSAELWDLRRSVWSPLPPLPDCRFSREPVEAIFSMGKLCMVNLRGRGPKYGAVYNIDLNKWEEMPAGMLKGWTGPAAAAAEDGCGPMYVVDEEKGELREYEWGSDSWRVVVASEELKGAAHMAAGGGKVCVARAGGETVVVVDMAGSRRGRIWTLAPPAGKSVVALHVLPRMGAAEP